MELELTVDNFDEKINGETPILVDFWASWCPPCRMMNPILKELAESQSEFLIGKVNVDNEQELATKYNATSIPTLVLFKNGKELARKVGAIPKDSLLNMISESV